MTAIPQCRAIALKKHPLPYKYVIAGRRAGWGKTVRDVKNATAIESDSLVGKVCVPKI